LLIGTIHKPVQSSMCSTMLNTAKLAKFTMR
jgi:hypothetical protein